ncbi:MAG: hypothetical protein FJZ47_12730, partial [Candidatus Tectomicrobia bacterium]|nr:hypothetical protein [Candidatus Tectomicrobia bacterium]
MGRGGGSARDHPVRAQSAGGRTAAAGPRRRASPADAGPRHDHRAAVARQARPDSDGGEAGVDHDAPSGSRAVPPRMATAMDAGRGVGADPGAACEALHGLLWTREPATTLVEGQEVVRQDTCRWLIEESQLTLQSGCRIEAWRLESGDRLAKAVVMDTSVAARMVALRDRAQQEPDASATVLLREDACAVLVATLGTGRAVSRLTLGQAVWWIGRLGGHLH